MKIFFTFLCTLSLCFCDSPQQAFELLLFAFFLVALFEKNKRDIESVYHTPKIMNILARF